MGTNKAEEKMTREQFIMKYLGNSTINWSEEHCDMMRNDLDKVINYHDRQSEIDELTNEVERLRKEREIEKMQIMGRQKGLIYYPNYVSFNLMSEEMAQKNHGQSLRTLNSRGGMSVMEILANIKNDRIVKGVETQDDINELNKLILNYPLPPINQ